MTVPTGWLTSPSGSGSAQINALLPVLAQGTYAEPPTATPPAPYNA